jgi:CRP-like cAMP-binding protein
MAPQTPFFQSLEPAARAELEEAGRRHELAANQVFLRVGVRNTSLFVVLSGSVRIERPGTERAVELAQHGPGAVFGEMSFLDGGETSASVRAAAPTVVLELGRDTLDALMDRSPALAARIWRALAFELKRRVVRTNELVEHYVDLAQVLRDNPGYAEAMGGI